MTGPAESLLLAASCVALVIGVIGIAVCILGRRRRW